eukprot:TRINITY_DN257_c0_g2_i1.p1 TRINITY_DN257_c0_g2~~TRINITY_DN257_c0_g2_i1.p1  ORF type:complete len:324 (-),score=68.32 TRINITY_DN257_c0_g2_i1:304-1275(-)
MSSDLRCFKLQNGVEMPSIGFGCAFGNWTSGLTGSTAFAGFTPEDAWPAIASALRAGYRHFDGAYVYGTHRHLGNLLGMQFADGSLKRSDVFITTKVFHPPAGISLNTIEKSFDMTNPDIDIRKRVMYDLEKSLDELGVGYVDLLLMHWPGAFGSKDAALNRRLRKECWEAMQEIYKTGRARAIGVSNFEAHHLETMMEDTEVKPMVNQIEVSPYLSQADLVAFCQKHEILVEAWAPFGSGATKVLQDPVIAELAGKYGKGVGQVILRWLLQRGISPLPKSGNEDRMRQNLDVFDFQLSEEDMAKMNALNCDKSSIPGRDPIA